MGVPQGSPIFSINKSNAQVDLCMTYVWLMCELSMERVVLIFWQLGAIFILKKP